MSNNTNTTTWNDLVVNCCLNAQYNDNNLVYELILRTVILLITSIMIIELKVRYFDQVKGPVYMGLILMHIAYIANLFINLFVLLSYDPVDLNNNPDLKNSWGIVNNTINNYFIFTVFYYTLFRMKSVQIYAEIFFYEVEDPIVIVTKQRDLKCITRLKSEPLQFYLSDNQTIQYDI